MSETAKKLRLDAALSSWPEVEKSASEWEELARSIDSGVNASELGHSGAIVSSEDLLIQPLGQIEGEGHNSAARVTSLETPRKEASKGTQMTMQPDRERDRRSLQDLAKLASTSMTPPPPSSVAASGSVPTGTWGPASSPASAPHSVSPSSPDSKKDDSGIVDLAMAAQSDPGAAARAQVTPLASGGLFDDEPASVRPGPVSAPVSSASSAAGAYLHQQPAPSMPPFSMPPASLPPASMGPASMAPASYVPSSIAPAPSSVSSLDAGAYAAQPKKKKGGVVLLFGALVAAAAVAAGGFFFVKGQHAKADAAALALANKPAPVVVATPEAKPADTVAANPTPSAPAEMDPNALPDPAKPAAVVAAKAGAPAAKPAAVAMAAPSPAKEESTKISQKDLPTAPTGPGGDLGAAMKGAVGDKDQAQTPAAAATGPAFAAGSVPQKPSQGAVTGALGAVLPAARACLGPDDAVSRASITFGSGGSVQTVNVSGGAAGKPAGDCIKKALMGAKVAPFAEATYTAPITIRH